MTRKDYIVIAGFMRDMKPVSSGAYALTRWWEFVNYFCVRFKQDNPRFDADKFREACSRGFVEAIMREEIINYHTRDGDGE